MDDDLVAERSEPGARNLAATALPLVAAVLEAGGRAVSDLDLIAVSVGPGSFTGLRIGLSIAKGIAFATGCEVVAVSSLEALASVVGRSSGLVCPVLDARRGEVYGAVFRADGDQLLRIAADCAASPERMAESIDQDCVLVGDGIAAYHTAWQRLLGERAEFLPFTEFHPRGGAVARLGRRRHVENGADAPAALVPRYCRASEAERMRG